MKTFFFFQTDFVLTIHFAFDNELVVFLGKVRIQTNGAIGTPLSVGGLDTVELCANVGSHTKFRSAQLSSVDKS